MTSNVPAVGDALEVINIFSPQFSTLKDTGFGYARILCFGYIVSSYRLTINIWSNIFV